MKKNFNIRYLIRLSQNSKLNLKIYEFNFNFVFKVATDALVAMEKAMKRDNIEVNDRQLACARINSPEGQEYLNGMAAAANFAWVSQTFFRLPTVKLM